MEKNKRIFFLYLHAAHVSGQSGLISDSRWDTTQKSRHLGTGLSETENVVNEKQYVLTFFVTEIFSNGQSGKGDTSTGAWGLVHLTVDEGDLKILMENIDIDPLVMQ